MCVCVCDVCVMRVWGVGRFGGFGLGRRFQVGSEVSEGSRGWVVSEGW